jgi:hypothetical protein
MPLSVVSAISLRGFPETLESFMVARHDMAFDSGLTENGT